MKTTINYIGIIKQGNKLLSLITDKPLSFNYKVVDIASEIKRCYENYTKGNSKYIFYIYMFL